MKIDPKPVLDHLNKQLISMKAGVADLEGLIHEIETDGINHPDKIYLQLNNTFTGGLIRCAYDITWVDLDQDFHYIGDDDKCMLCDKCARKMAPYLTNVLVPFIIKHTQFFHSMCDRHPDIILPLEESRVPAIMDFLTRAKKLSAFL